MRTHVFICKMKSLSILLTLAFVTLTWQICWYEVDKEWTAYKVTYNHTFDIFEEIKRRKIFQWTLEEITEHNKQFELGVHSYRAGLNQLSHLTGREFEEAFTCNEDLSQNTTVKKGIEIDDFANFTAPLPKKIDWTVYKNPVLVGPVKYQYLAGPRCGSCWAFGSLGTLETRHARWHRRLNILSEQQLIDCSRSYGNKGCKGGSQEASYRYIIDIGGVQTLATYPNTGKDDAKCKFNRKYIGAKMKNFKYVKSRNELAMKKALVNVGPIGAVMFVDEIFRKYKTGVYDRKDCPTRPINHAVTIVGYGTEGGKDFWKIKNSWSDKWGDKGYFKIARGKNRCGIATQGIYPVPV